MFENVVVDYIARSVFTRHPEPFRSGEANALRREPPQSRLKQAGPCEWLIDPLEAHVRHDRWGLVPAFRLRFELRDDYRTLSIFGGLTPTFASRLARVEAGQAATGPLSARPIA